MATAPESPIPPARHAVRADGALHGAANRDGRPRQALLITLLIIIFLVAMWAAVLAAPLLQSRGQQQFRGGDSIKTFQRQLATLDRSGSDVFCDRRRRSLPTLQPRRAVPQLRRASAAQWRPSAAGGSSPCSPRPQCSRWRWHSFSMAPLLGASPGRRSPRRLCGLGLPHHAYPRRARDERRLPAPRPDGR